MNLIATHTLLLINTIIFLSCGNASQPSEAKTLGIVVTKLDKSIWNMYQDSKDNYWFGSNGNGVYKYDGKELRQFSGEDGLCSMSIRGIQEDKNGNIYFDTPEGVCKYDGESFITLTPVQSSVIPWQLNPDDLWFHNGGSLLGALRYDGKTLYQLEFPDMELEKMGPRGDAYTTFSINKDSKGNLWFGTIAAGVCCYDGTSFEWIYERDLLPLEDGRAPGIRNIIEDKDGNLWFSHIIKKYKINQNDSTGTFSYETFPGVTYNQPPNNIELPYFMSAVRGNKGNLWMISYSEGVWRYDGTYFEQYKIMESDKEVLIMSIYKDNHGTLWLTTDNSGVYKHDGYSFVKFEV